ncbi:MAG: hypothetical protein ACLSGB_14450 [Dorea sp.]
MFPSGDYNNRLQNCLWGYDAELFELAKTRIQDIFYQFSGHWIQYLWIVAFFTALNNGMISWLRFHFFEHYYLQMAAVLIPPGILGVNGIFECRYSGRALYTSFL